MNSNIILNTDSYKYSQFNQYPPNTEIVSSYIESRGAKGGFYDRTVFFGLQMFLKEYLSKPITLDQINEAEEIVNAHGLPFNRAGWEYILEQYGGFLPLCICAVKEGSIIPTKNLLVSVKNTNPNCGWLTSFMETAILRAVWYPTTVATYSWYMKQLILHSLKRNGTPESIDFKLHDFGFRGVSSKESAGIGGLAHLVNFQGTDTMEALLYGRRYYNAPMAGFSIPATEHSTITSWGRMGEADAYENFLNKYAQEGKIIACVSDSYNIYDACSKIWGEQLKQKVISSGATLVIRPDSGYPPEVVMECLHILDAKFGHTINNKGYKVLNNVRLIQGDGVSYEIVGNILSRMETAGFSSDNIAFGQGGGLLQAHDRDTLKFAMKCSAILVDGEWRDVYKQPITDMGKESKKGLIDLYKIDGEYVTKRIDYRENPVSETQMVFYNGIMYNSTNLETVRKLAQSMSV
ncbi:nicotinamide phosphoribosyltransferase [Synechococcus phage B3]|nr:nicotinamide phosphoribosyltransferase [Synechococcus phage B3]QGT54677.1 nicotinamide phosphoribosyltransferase [Synechococcus phage B23]